MSVLRILIIFTLVLSICTPVLAGDWFAPWFIENREETEVEKSYEKEGFSTEMNPAKHDFTNQNVPQRELWRTVSLSPVAISIRHAPIYLLLASLRR
jgi:hypothetical protein